MRDVFPNLFYDEDEDQANSTSSSWSNRSDFEHPSLLVRRLRRQTLIDFHRPKDERALSKQVKNMGERIPPYKETGKLESSHDLTQIL